MKEDARAEPPACDLCGEHHDRRSECAMNDQYDAAVASAVTGSSDDYSYLDGDDDADT